MKKKIVKKEEITNKDLAQILGTFGNNIGSNIKSLDSKLGNLGLKVGSLDSKIESFGKNLDLRITKLENYMKEGFSSIDNKIEYVDKKISH